jgi:ABC-type transport system involved in cytochrome bd biosynthesis fused ATPase/permease subunit
MNLTEPTSSVDLASEGRITESLKSISGQSIVVIISHRTNVLRNCSKLMVVFDGTVEIYDGWDSALKSNSYVQSIANEVGSVGND